MTANYQDAYKAPLPYQTEVTGVGAASAPRGAKEGDSCLIGGMEGHLVEIDGELTCIPDSVDDAASLSDREIAHLKYLDHVSNAWRTPAATLFQIIVRRGVPMRRRRAMRSKRPMRPMMPKFRSAGGTRHEHHSRPTHRGGTRF